MKINLKVYKKVFKVVIVGACVLASGTGLAIMVYEDTVDHANEYCKLCDYIGLEHQANAINKDSAINFRTEAIYYQDDDIKKTNELQCYDFQCEHQIDFINAYLLPSSTDTNTIDLKLLDKQYAVADSGYIYDYQPTGERVEVYDKDDINGKRLVRVFK